MYGCDIIHGEKAGKHGDSSAEIHQECNGKIGNTQQFSEFGGVMWCGRKESET